MRQPDKINSLNGIRGYAVLLVLLAHGSNGGLKFEPFINFSGAGRYGVFLFFVLSSFLLTRQFLEAELNRNSMAEFLKYYFIRRFLRIYPLFIAALLAYHVLNRLGYVMVPSNKKIIVESLLLLDGRNFFWTIPVEFQYYFLLPLVAFALMRRPRVGIVLATTVVFAIAWTYAFPPRYVPNLAPFLPIFVAGSATAFISVEISRIGRVPPAGTAIFNLAAIVFFTSFVVLTPFYWDRLFNEDVPRTGFDRDFLLFTVLSCGLIICVVHGDGIVKRLMESRFLVFWGMISFSAYLWHEVVLYKVSRMQGAPALRLLLFVAATGMLSYLSYKYIEYPLSKHRTFSRIFSSIGLTKSGPASTRG